MENKKIKKLKKYFEDRKAQNKKATKRFAITAILMCVLFLIMFFAIFFIFEPSIAAVANLILIVILIFSQALAFAQFDTFARVDEQFLKLIEELEKENE